MPKKKAQNESESEWDQWKDVPYRDVPADVIQRIKAARFPEIVEAEKKVAQAPAFQIAGTVMKAQALAERLRRCIPRQKRVIRKVLPRLKERYKHDFDEKELWFKTFGAMPIPNLLRLETELDVKVEIFKEASRDAQETADAEDLADNSPAALLTALPHAPAGVRPIFQDDLIDDIFEALSQDFGHEDHERLRQLLNTGDDVTPRVVYLGPGASIIDAFRLLLGGPITNTINKKQLGAWIRRNINYMEAGKICEMRPRLTQDNLSTQVGRTKNKIIEVLVGGPKGYTIRRAGRLP